VSNRRREKKKARKLEVRSPEGDDALRGGQERSILIEKGAGRIEECVVNE